MHKGENTGQLTAPSQEKGAVNTETFGFEGGILFSFQGELGWDSILYVGLIGGEFHFTRAPSEENRTGDLHSTRTRKLILLLLLKCSWSTRETAMLLLVWEMALGAAIPCCHAL